MSHADPATSTPTPQPEAMPPALVAQQAPGNLWNDFLRRNLLLAGLASAGAMRREQSGREAPRSQG
jgi:hypothetical protein